MICSLLVLVLGARDADVSENGLGPQGVPAAEGLRHVCKGP